MNPAAVNRILRSAMQHATAGRYEEALRALKSEGEVALGHPVGRNILGGIYMEQGKLDEAVRAFERAAKSAPSFPEAHCNRGLALEKLGRRDEALAAFDRALKQRRDYPIAHFNRGNLLADLGRLDEAVAAFGEAIRLKPDFADAHVNRGSAHARHGNFVAALADANRALALRPGFGEASILQASALAGLGHAAEALAAIDGFLARDPTNASALLARSRALIAGERHQEALAAADAMLERQPASVAGQVARATALWKLGRTDEALAAANAALALDPKESDAHAVRGFILGDLLRFDEQMRALEAAVRFGKGNARHLHSLGVALSDAGRAAEARDIYKEATRLAPDDPLIHYHSSLIRLYLGDFEGGFAEHEWRLRKADIHGARYATLAPPWTGEEIAGKSLLVYFEQGLGDLIQFARYIPRVAETGARVCLLAPPVARNLIARSFPAVEVVSSLGMKGGFDYQVPLFSLGHVFGTRLETIPAEVPYLAADPALVEKWRGRVGTEGFRIGVTWQGNPEHGKDRFRSVDPSQFAPLAAIPGVRLISLQAVHGLDRLDNLPPDVKIESFGDEIARNPEGVSEIAGLLHSLDLVVSIDSAIAHLAGALARPVFVALRKQPEWRWMEDRTDSPWYPTMTLFRQTDPLAWAEVYEAMAREVEGMVR